MKVCRAQVEDNRARILAAAARLFREHGFDGVGIAQITQAAGLTHGAFYRHFASKQDLIAQSISESFTQAARRWNRRIAEHGLAGHVARYLSAEHRDTPDNGCVVSSLAADASRCEAPIRTGFAGGVETLLKELETGLAGLPPAQRRTRALVMLAAMSGALTLSRAAGDDALSDEILATVARELTLETTTGA